MSKSLGNFYTLADLVARGYDPRAVKYLLVSAHYRQQLNFTVDNVKGAESAMKRLDKGISALCAKAGVARADFDSAAFPRATADEALKTAYGPAIEALFDDMNTAAALGVMWNSLKADSANAKADLAALKTVLYALGISPIPAEEAAPTADEIPAEIRDMAQARWDAKKNRDFAKADELRKALTAKGWTILDRKDGFDIKKA
jgi:cysteinyl-tRNA synthetase